MGMGKKRLQGQWYDGCCDPFLPHMSIECSSLKSSHHIYVRQQRDDEEGEKVSTSSLVVLARIETCSPCRFTGISSMVV
jgi:hypothetical protein